MMKKKEISRVPCNTLYLMAVYFSSASRKMCVEDGGEEEN